MPKVYLDWNAYSGLAKGENFELIKVFEQKNLILLYSIYHLSDVKKSIKIRGELDEFVAKEVKTLRDLTNNRCLFREASGNVQSGFLDPTEYLNSLYVQESILNNFSLDAIFDEIKVSGYEDTFTDIKNSLKSIEVPISGMESDARSKEKVPIDNLLKEVSQLYITLTKTEEFKILRLEFQKVGIDHKSFHSTKNPLNIIDNFYRDNGFGSLKDDDTFFKMDRDNWYDKIIHLYLILDICGYRSDQIKVTDKSSKTFLNILNDAHHTAFASRCEFYISNDARNREKSKAVYEYLGIKTKIFEPKEFKSYYDRFLILKDFDDYYSHLIDLVKDTGNFKISDSQSTSGSDVFEFTGEDYFFTFFNKIYIPTYINPNEMSIVLSREVSAGSKYFILFEEMSLLLENLIFKLGLDENGRGNYEGSEDLNEDKVLRLWVFSSMRIELMVQDKCVLLYFDYLNN